MKKDPPFTGTCPVCGNATEALRIHGQWHSDPFDSTICAKVWHGVPSGDTRSVSVEYDRAGKRRDPMMRP